MTLGGNVLLFMSSGNKLKTVMLYRDAKAPGKSNCWSTFGGFCTEAPSLTAEKELREELAFLLKGNQEYLLLQAALPIVQGTSISEMRSTNILSRDDLDRARTRAKTRYDDFNEDWSIRPIEITLEEFPGVQSLESQISIFDSSNRTEINQVTSVNIFRWNNHV